MIQRYIEYLLFGVLAIFSLALVLEVKAIFVTHQWLNYKSSALGFDGLIAWFCVMFGVRHFHIWLLKLFGKKSMFDKN